jgi:GTPase SAR1 family protein
MITMMGAIRSGKTSFLVALYYEIIERQEKNREWKILPKTNRARDLLREGFDSFKNREFPRATEPRPGQPLESLRYEITRPVAKRGWLSPGGIETIELDMLDPSGEYFSNPELLEAQNEEAVALRNTLTNASGILCIVDPDRADGNDYFPLLFNNFTKLSSLMHGEDGGRIDVPVAICLAKADQHLDAFNNAEQYINNLMGRTAFSVLLNYCGNMAFFATSAVGRDNVERLADGTYRPKGEPRPENVLAPIDWLLDNQP